MPSSAECARILALAATLLAALPAVAQTPRGTISGPAQIVDGDTLRIDPVLIRLHGIDAPETGQRCRSRNGATWPCGAVAARTLDTLVGDRTVTCTALGRDRHGRTLSRCDAGDGDLAGMLTMRGLAWAYTAYSDDYADRETASRARGTGIWQHATQPPWAYRHEARHRTGGPQPRDCAIKGNISRSGERIFHLPGSASYARTRIDPSRNERWFCDADTALAAGWRAARSR